MIDNNIIFVIVSAPPSDRLHHRPPPPAPATGMAPTKRPRKEFIGELRLLRWAMEFSSPVMWIINGL